MNPLLKKQSASSTNFKKYILNENRLYCMILLSITVLEFILFKLLYPFPDFFSDSYSYLIAADLHLNVNIWPIGYSRFLSFFHSLTTSPLALVFLQYFVWSVSALYFYLTVTYFFSTGKTTRTILCLFLFFNPLFLYLANYVTSDMLFVSMSLVWVAQLIWILNRPRVHQILFQAVLMFILFTFRYNAMIYPLIAGFVIFLSKMRIWKKLIGAVLGPALITPFILWSSYAAKALTGTAQFPPILGGWQWANNALYFRAFIQEDSNSFPTPQTAELDRIARDFFRLPYHPQDLLASEVANFFIRHPEAPLKQYMARHFQPTTSAEYVAAWGKSAIIFDKYGKFLIKKHPIAFARYYLLMNSKNYFIPPLEKLETYNLGEDEMWDEAQYWFHYKSPKVWCISKNLQGDILSFFPALFLVLNIYFVAGLVIFIRRGGLRKARPADQYVILAITTFLVLNAAFSIFANIIVIRYQIFPMIILLTLSLLLKDYADILSAATNRTMARLTQIASPGIAGSSR